MRTTSKASREEAGARTPCLCSHHHHLFVPCIYLSFKDFRVFSVLTSFRGVSATLWKVSVRGVIVDSAGEKCEDLR